MLARFVEVALWAILILAVAFAIVYRKRWMTWRIEPAQARRRRAPAVVVGVDIRPESLPADIPATAWTCWRNGDPRGCLSLLYRGALATLVHARGVELPASATEADCVRRVRASAPPEVATFFDRLTGSWQAIAYARRAPTEALARSLCDDWHRHMETAS